MKKYVPIALAVSICLLVGFLSGMSTQDAVQTWYPMLKKPSFNPPNWVFAPVWTILYVLMGISAGLIWNKMSESKDEVRLGIRFFVIQLALNALWSYLFFGLKNPFLALVEIALLWLMICETYLKFRKVSSLAGWFLVPYLLWVAFAMVLNGSIWWLNR